MLIYFYVGALSWQDISETSNHEDTNNKIKYLKMNIIEKSNIPDVLITFIKYVRSLEFDEKPNYYLISDNFKREIEIISKNS
jgi:hypothetical protein